MCVYVIIYLTILYGYVLHFSAIFLFIFLDMIHPIKLGLYKVLVKKFTISRKKNAHIHTIIVFFGGVNLHEFPACKNNLTSFPDDCSLFSGISSCSIYKHSIEHSCGSVLYTFWQCFVKKKKRRKWSQWRRIVSENNTLLLLCSIILYH